MTTYARPTIRNGELQRFFKSLSTRVTLQNGSPQEPSLVQVKRFFGAIRFRLARAERQREIDHTEASRFNVFDLIEPDENRLSDILALLLDPAGHHSQGDLFLRLLLKQLGHKPVSRLTQSASVSREVPTHGIEKYRRRMDVLVEAGLRLAVENKTVSSEQPEQVKDYLEHLDYCHRRDGNEGILIYLTPDGRRPDSLDRVAQAEAEAQGRLHCWSYPCELHEWLKACQRECRAEKIRAFLEDFIYYIDMELRPPPNTGMEDDNEN